MIFTAVSLLFTEFGLLAQPRPEYPRPQFERDSWRNLNGEWTYELDPVKTGHERNLYDRDRSTVSMEFTMRSNAAGSVLTVNVKDGAKTVYNETAPVSSGSIVSSLHMRVIYLISLMSSEESSALRRIRQRIIPGDMETLLLPRRISTSASKVRCVSAPYSGCRLNKVKGLAAMWALFDICL